MLTFVAVTVLAALMVGWWPDAAPDVPDAADVPVAAPVATEEVAKPPPAPATSLSPARVSLSSRATTPTGSASPTRVVAPTRRSDAAPSPPTSRPSRPASPSPSGRSSPGELNPLPASRERHLRSTGGGSETHIDFVNERAERVTVYWLDYGGDRRQYAVLQPGQRHRQHTYVGHPWVVTTAGGRALVCFLPAASTGTAVIR
ncbi:von Hippel-Lindau disease tumour suppressor protein [Micromonospora nigra]|uniref:von Hippel-Lindau disease tumour suppressor protein n=1 Tax=Micromonospora nigra TaxID=145857 RepID=A0A1C6S531_9ACTN|nr:hypothetical protein [Micromonospora nigra]SCL24560.1 von Hippel-Lindau disease tumour suppressor protein [Micromonospora nigra]